MITRILTRGRQEGQRCNDVIISWRATKPRIQGTQGTSVISWEKHGNKFSVASRGNTTCPLRQVVDLWPQL